MILIYIYEIGILSSFGFLEVSCYQDITVLNVGNGGFMHFGVASTVPWLAVSPSSGSLAPGAGGQVIQLTASLAGLSIGEENGTLQIWSDGGARDYAIRLTVPPLDGVYAGEVIVTNMQSRSAVPMRWPIVLSLNLQGLSTLSANGAPYISTDVTMPNSGTTSQFDLFGSGTLASDDSKNPFGVPIQRLVRFHGARILPTAGQAFGVNLGLAGVYEERLTGLRSGDIVLSGFFTLNAKTDKTTLEVP